MLMRRLMAHLLRPFARMEQAWEALRGLYVVGQAEDLPAITPYERDVPEISAQVRQQAMETERAIQSRAKL